MCAQNVNANTDDHIAKATVRKNLLTVSEYALLGNSTGMLTDSRSFSSYARFDFFRRLLADFIGEYVENGEYDETSVVALATNICYTNAKEMIDP